MDFYVTSHFSNAALRLELKASDGGECKATARMLSRIGEYDERRLFLEDGYPSMRAYCMGELKYTEQKASKRIYAARTARKFPVLFVALADGRLHLTGLVMLARHLRSGNLDELLAAATHKTADEIAQLIAERFPRPDLPERLEAIAPPPVPIGGAQHSARNAGNMFSAGPQCPGPVPEHSARNVETSTHPLQHSPGNAASPMPARMTPLAPQRFGFQCTVDQETQELWQSAKALLSHEIPTGEMPQLLKAVLKLAVGQLMKRKFAATDRPAPSRGSADPRLIPAAVKRVVAERDREQCSFVSDAGKRCEERRFLEFDHEIPVARGGEATIENIRLRCRAHNQYEAERAFGADFMEQKRREATRARAVARDSPPGAAVQGH